MIDLVDWCSARRAGDELTPARRSRRAARPNDAEEPAGGGRAVRPRENQVSGDTASG